MSHQILKNVCFHSFKQFFRQIKCPSMSSNCLIKLRLTSISSYLSSALLGFGFFISILLHLPAHAQVLGNSSTLMQKVINELTVIGGLVVTIAIMFCGFRMVFQAAQWKDIAPIFWGGVLIGGAASIAGTVLS